MKISKKARSQTTFSWTQEARGTAALESRTYVPDNIHTTIAQPNPPHCLPSSTLHSDCQREPPFGRNHPLPSPTQHPQVVWQPGPELARALATGLMKRQLQHSNSLWCCRAVRDARRQAEAGASKSLEINTRSEVQQVQSRNMVYSPEGFGPNCSLV